MENIEKSLLNIQGEKSKVLALKLHKFSQNVHLKFMKIKSGQKLILKNNFKTSYKFIDTVFDQVKLTHSTIYLEKENCKLGLNKDFTSKIISSF